MRKCAIYDVDLCAAQRRNSDEWSILDALAAMNARFSVGKNKDLFRIHALAWQHFACLLPHMLREMPIVHALL